MANLLKSIKCLIFNIVSFCIFILATCASCNFTYEKAESLSININTIKKIVEESESFIEKKEFRRANELLDNALEVLGNSYLDNNTIDDTGMKLIIGRKHYADGKLELASIIKLRVLKNRVHLFKNNKLRSN